MATKRLSDIFPLRWLPQAMVLAGAALLGVGCSQDEGFADGGCRVAVVFNTSLAGQTAGPLTKAAGTAWDTGDEVGIFMLTAGGTLPGNIVDAGTAAAADNRLYTADASGVLSPPAGNPIYYPQSGNVDFIAYYPHRTAPGTNPYIYKVDVSDQSDPAAIDLLYAKKPGVAKSQTAVPLVFEHQLSKLTIGVAKGTGMASVDFTTMTVSIGGMPVTADFDLNGGATPLTVTGGPAAFVPRIVTAGSLYDAILVPQTANAYASRTVVFTVGGAPYTWAIPAATAFEGGSHHTYTVTVNKTGLTVSTGDITDWTGTTDQPTGGDAEQILRGIPAVWIPAGTFLMGATDTEGGNDWEKPQHRVRLTKGFYMSKCEITNAQYAAFLNATGVQGVSVSSFYTGSVQGNKLIETSEGGSDWGLHWDGTNSKWVPVVNYENHPVIYVTWYGAKAYADWVGGSLPTEAQWEYACRAGTTTAHSFEAGNIGDYVWYYDNSSGKTYPVGEKKPNPRGLYDMHGNVWEWCSDWYGSYPSTEVTDPTGPASGGGRVFRGGSWFSYAQFCRSAYRSFINPGYAFDFIGFRMVFVP